MRKAQITILIIIITGCSSRLYISEESKIQSLDNLNAIVTSVTNNNISSAGFFIERGDLWITKDKNSSKFVFTVKHELPDRYLFSIKNNTGIEGARLYITKDTLLINERLNKKLLFGKTKELEKVFGFSFFFIPMALGDFNVIEDSIKTVTELVDNQLIVRQPVNGMILTSVLNGDVGKVASVYFDSPGIKECVSIKYSKYMKKQKHIPGIIEIRDKRRAIDIKIRIDKVSVPWSGKIEFIPGSGYKKEEIK